MREVIIFILVIIVVFLATYGLMTGEDRIMPYIQLLLGVLFLVWAISGLQEKRKSMGVLFMLVSGLSFL